MRHISPDGDVADTIGPKPNKEPGRFTIADFRAARLSGVKVPFLTCYDFTSARLMEEAGLRAMLVGDSAANVILGYPTTLPVSLDFMIEITAAVRRGAPRSLLMADLPFGSYQASVAQGAAAAMRMVQLSGCDCVKLEVAASHAKLVSRLADAGVAVVAHLGLRPQAIGLLGAYKAAGKTAALARDVIRLASAMEKAGAASILIEAVPAEVAAAVVEAVQIPVVGCGAGPACHGHVVVTHDLLGLTQQSPRFAPRLADLSVPFKQAVEEWMKRINDRSYPGAEHQYEMPEAERRTLKAQLANR